MILSVDMAHAVHPNYASKHDKHHSPQMNSGLVIKTNVNQRYATSGITGFIVRELGSIVFIVFVLLIYILCHITFVYLFLRYSWSIFVLYSST